VPGAGAKCEGRGPTNASHGSPTLPRPSLARTLAKWPYWLTFKSRRKDRGGSVRRGEKSTIEVFWKMLDGIDRETGEATLFAVMPSGD
jgi:hypothetical protein